MFSSRFMLFPTFKKKIGVNKNIEQISGGGGGESGGRFCFLEKYLFLISFCVICYFQH